MTADSPVAHGSDEKSHAHSWSMTYIPLDRGLHVALKPTPGCLATGLPR